MKEITATEAMFCAWKAHSSKRNKAKGLTVPEAFRLVQPEHPTLDFRNAYKIRDRALARGAIELIPDTNPEMYRAISDTMPRLKSGPKTNRIVCNKCNGEGYLPKPR